MASTRICQMETGCRAVTQRRNLRVSNIPLRDILKSEFLKIKNKG
jgi:hypothetical protein